MPDSEKKPTQASHAESVLERKDNAEIAGAERDVRHIFWFQTLPLAINYLVLILSLGLIAFISWDTFKGVDYLENNLYMTYQLIVCMFFLLEYFYRIIISKHKVRFFFLAFPFLLISIPYLNIIEHYQIAVNHELLIYLCFIPIVRGLVALVMVVSYITKRMVTTVFMSYIFVIIPAVYMSALIFYVAEKDINVAVKNFWYALWWAGMSVTTIGCYINPVTGTGMVIGFFLSLMGLIMLPLFTVYSGDVLNVFTGKSSSTHKS